MSALPPMCVARSTQSVAQAEHVHEYTCGGWSVYGSHVTGGSGQLPPASKGSAANRVVLLEPVVERIAAEGLRDLVPLGEDHVLLVGPRLIAGVGHRLEHPRADGVLAHCCFTVKRTAPLAQSMSTSCGPGGTKICASSQAAKKASSYACRAAVCALIA